MDDPTCLRKNPVRRKSGGLYAQCKDSAVDYFKLSWNAFLLPMLIIFTITFLFTLCPKEAPFPNKIFLKDCPLLSRIDRLCCTKPYWSFSSVFRLRWQVLLVLVLCTGSTRYFLGASPKPRIASLEYYPRKKIKPWKLRNCAQRKKHTLRNSVAWSISYCLIK